MSESTASSKFEYLKDYGRIALFYFIGLSIFFIAGFLIITLRVSTKEKIEVPNLVGKLYLDEHNRLIEDGFKVKLSRTFSIEYPFGYIVSQSISPGVIAKEGAKLVLLVNQSKTVIKTPQLVGQKEELVAGILASIPQGRRTFSLNKGVVTYIESDKPKGDILAQFPPVGTPVRPGDPVSLLVSAGDKKVKTSSKKQKKKKTVLNLPDLNGTSIEIVKALAYHYQLPLEISAKETDEIKENGQVLAYSLSSESKTFNWGNEERVSLQVTVGRLKSFADAPEDEPEFPYQFVWVDPSDIDLPPGTVTLAQVSSGNRQQVVGVEAKKYFSPAYLKNTGGPLVFFKEDQNNFVAWQGYDPYILDAPLVEKTEIEKKIEDDEAGGEQAGENNTGDVRKITIEESKEEKKVKTEKLEEKKAGIPQLSFSFDFFEI